MVMSSNDVLMPSDGHVLAWFCIKKAETVLCGCIMKVKFRIYEPLESFRAACPWIFVTSSGTHQHPIPLPQKTPPHIRSAVNRLLERLGTALADLTPRRFLRHPIVKDYLAEVLPNVPSPTLSDLHVSLANREHLAYYIDQVKKEQYPYGTGWEGPSHLSATGVRHYKECNDRDLPQEDLYIRKIVELPADACAAHLEDEPVRTGQSEDVRMVICMTKEGSRRLLTSQYLQSDIGFKRVIGFYEFELALELTVAPRTGVIFCRVFLNRQTATAHERLFREIDDIVKIDTGRRLQWRHIHGNTVEDTDGMILHFAADQHPGQAKGLGLYLQSLTLERKGVYDLHEPDRLLTDLSPYEHLHRVFRLCTVHALRNIHDARGITDEVRNLMRSLICMEHPAWDRTLEEIRTLGGKVGADWIQNKVDSKFALEGLCWEKSYIPWYIWKAGEANSNLVESVHADVNREGISCSLLGGIAKGRSFDAMKMKTLSAFETSGIRPSYKSGHLMENAAKNLKRKHRAHRNQLAAEDAKIAAHNARIEKARSSLTKAAENLSNLEEAMERSVLGRNSVEQRRVAAALERAQKALRTAEVKYEKEAKNGEILAGSGSGRIAAALK
ncbi:hypothetical protein H0H92_015743 [Tricholoma furcatifolium]|nr:hypothetical protein H0H92_015743 [Tricholoma furcatifolium]